MKLFEYEATSSSGAAVTGRATAASELELDRELEAQGLTLTEARPIRRGETASGGRLKRDELVSFTTQLSTMLGAGVPVVHGLSELGKRMRTPAARNLVNEMVTVLMAGGSLSEAMEAHPRTFPQIYRSSVGAGEISGSLPEVLTRLATFLDWARSMRSTTIQALIYPCILIVAILGLIVTLLTFLLPRIIGLFPGGRADLPTETQIVIAISDFLTGNIVAISVFVIAVAGGFAFAMKRPGSRVILSGLLLRIPRFGEVSRMLGTSKFAATVSTLHDAGCEVFTTLSVAGESCGNAFMARSFARVAERVRKGQTITESLEREPMMDPLLIQMAGVGEQSGNLGRSFRSLTAYYDQEVPRVVKWFLALAEPAILIVAGGVVAFILLAALLPIFSLYENIG